VKNALPSPSETPYLLRPIFHSFFSQDRGFFFWNSLIFFARSCFMRLLSYVFSFVELIYSTDQNRDASSYLLRAFYLHRGLHHTSNHIEGFCFVRFHTSQNIERSYIFERDRCNKILFK